MIKCFDLFFFCQNRSRKRILYARNHPQFQTAGIINLNLRNRCVKFSGRKPEISHAVCHRHIFYKLNALQTVRMSTNHGVCTSFYTKVCNLCLILPIMDLSFCSPVNIRDHIITVLLRTLQFFLPYLFLLGL